MAGDVKTPESGEQVAAPDYQNPFPSIQRTLEAILDALRGSAPGEVPSIFDILAAGGITFGQHQWQRIRVSLLVVSASAAGTATVRIGSFTRTWQVGVGTTTLPFPYVIERGTDVVLGGSAADITGYLIATPE